MVLSLQHRLALSLAMALLLTSQSLWVPFVVHPVFGQFTEDALTVELSATGEARITEEITPNTTVPRIALAPISANVSNLLAVDESNIILRSVLTNNEIRIDTIGAAHVTLTYNAEIVNRTLDIWNVEYTSVINSRIILPPGSELLFVNSIPVDIVENAVVMPPGEINLSYKTRSATTGAFSVSWNGTAYNVGILSVAEIPNVSFDQPSKSIVLGLDSQEPILVMIPRNLLGGPYDVRAGNGQPVEFKEYYQNASHSWIRVEPANADSIRITGTTVIPEFQFSSLLVTGITISLVILLSYTIGRKWTSFHKYWGVKG
jgi:hypothetical protein